MFKNFYLFIYDLFLAVLGLLAFSRCSKLGLPLVVVALLDSVAFSCCGAQALGHAPFNSCSTWAHSLLAHRLSCPEVWDFPRLGIEPVSLNWKADSQPLTAREAVSVMICTGNTGSSLHTFFFFLNLICQLCASHWRYRWLRWTILDFCLLWVSLPNEGQEESEWSVKSATICELAGLAWLSTGRRLYVKLERHQPL